MRVVNKAFLGKAYFEATMTTLTGGGTTVGVCNASWVLSTGGNSSVNAAYAYKSGPIWINNSSAGGTLGTLVSGSIVGVAVDLVNELIWFRVCPSGNWNGSSTANPATATGGYSIGAISSPLKPVYVFAGFTASGDVVTANFGATAFSGTVPSGFAPGWSTANGPTLNVVTQVGVEVWVQNPSANRVTQIGAEIWRSVGVYVAPVAEPIIMFLA